MKVLFRLAVALAVLATFVQVPGGMVARADQPVTIQGYAASWTTSFTVQNQGTATATIQIDYYNADGSIAKSVSDTIPAGGSKLYYQGDPNNGLANGQYSVVISSDQPIAAITNQAATGPTMNGAYNGFAGNVDTATNFYLPAILRNYYGWNTVFYVQNAGTADASVTMTYYGPAGNQVKQATATIKPGAAASFDQGGMADLGGSFNGSVRITSSQPVAAMVNEINSAAALVETYNGYPDGATTLYLPIIMNGYYGWVTSFTVQNVDTADANVTVTFSNGKVTSATIPAGSSKLWYQPNDGLPNGFNGAATVTATNGKKVVAIVNEASATAASSYNAFSAGATTISLPVLMNKYYGWITSYTIQNVSNQPANVTVTYSGGVQQTATIAPQSSKIWYQPNDGLNDGYNGSATVTSNVQVVAVVNEVISTNGDGQMSYNGIAK